jgi:hypothetical protein
MRKLEKVLDKKYKEVEEWYGVPYQNANLRLPLIFNHLLREASTPADVVKLAFDLRNSDPAIKFREKCAEVTSIKE